MIDVTSATRPEDLFGTLIGSPAEQLATATVRYRALARELHPDAGGDGDTFARLQQLWEAARIKIADGSYGDGYAVLVDPIVIQTRRRAFKLTKQVGRGDVCNFYVATYQDSDGDDVGGLIKIARSPNYNDLLANEARMLKLMLGNVDTYDILAPYLPGYIETFGYRAPGEKKPRQATAFKAAPYRLLTLSDVRRAFPMGVLPKHASWIFRRLLMALGLVHEHGIVHGALLPEHILIQPEMHGLVLIDWKQGVESGNKVGAWIPRWQKLYAPEIIAKEPATSATDIYMAARCFSYVLGANGNDLTTINNVSIRAFIRHCLSATPERRPQDAFALKDEFEDLRKRLWGHLPFTPFNMP